VAVGGRSLVRRPLSRFERPLPEEQECGVDPLTWDEVAERLARARFFWLHTTGPSGTPNASPMRGVMVDAVLYLHARVGPERPAI
jgi:hypothetical protein